MALTPHGLDVLPRQQGRILAMLSMGFTQEQIAMGLGRSLNTVRSLSKLLYRRLGVNNSHGAVAEGFRNGYLE